MSREPLCCLLLHSCLPGSDSCVCLCRAALWCAVLLLLSAGAPLVFELNSPSNPTLSSFPSNGIRTSKYNVLTFLPLNLFEQFRRLANQYFLLIVLLQLIPGVSPFPIYTSVVPLVFILAVSAISEAREDWVRHRADSAANNRQTTRLVQEAASGSEQQQQREQQQVVRSSDVRVGDILLVKRGEEFVADLILLASSRDDSTAYVNTANLDGEAAPKVRVSPTVTSQLRQPQQLAALRGRIRYEQPSTSLYRFQGQLVLRADTALPRTQAVDHYSDAPDAYSTATHTATAPASPSGASEDTFGVGDKQLLLRGSRLINTDWVYGLVVYTGPHTKMMLNRNPAQLKFSRYEKGLNRLVLVVLAVNLFICLLLSFFYVGVDQSWSCRYDLCANDGSQWLLGFLTHYILFSFMVPQSLYVTIQLVKIGQAAFIQWDREMTYRDPDSGELRSASVKSNSLNEELGHVDVVCTDKTGTLTQNRMQLSQCSVDGQLFFQCDDRHEESRIRGHTSRTNKVINHSTHTATNTSTASEQQGRKTAAWLASVTLSHPLYAVRVCLSVCVFRLVLPC